MNSMDVWQIMSYLNVFFVLVEYCLVLWLSKGVPLNDVSVNKISPRSRKKMVRSQIYVKYNNSDCHFLKFQGKVQRRMRLAGKVENTARIIMPMYTFVFTIIYFAVCITVMNKVYQS